MLGEYFAHTSTLEKLVSYLIFPMSLQNTVIFSIDLSKVSDKYCEYTPLLLASCVQVQVT